MADFTTPQLITTNVGLAAASVATPTGPFIEIDRFKIGSAYGYTPTAADTDINGDLLFEGAPLTYKYVGDNTLDIVCRLPADSGPFEFGEVALFLSSDEMFAKAAFSEPQIKYSSLGTNVLSTYTFNCLLKLAQAVAVFQVNTLCTPPSIWEVDLWSDVYPPALSANPDIPAILVRELDNHGNSSLIHQAGDAFWTVGTNYHFHSQALITGSTVNYADVPVASVGLDALSFIPREFVVGFDTGYLRSCTSVTQVGSDLRFQFIDAMGTAPPVGSVMTINTNRPPVGPTLLNVVGDASGSVMISGGTANLTLTISAAALSGHTQEWATAGTYSFIVPDEVFDIYIDAGGAGAGGGGAGGGWFQDRGVLISEGVWEYRAGGGGGGGGAGDTVINHHMSVTPGETITIVIGAKGLGGAGGIAPGGNAANGTVGGDTSVQSMSETLLRVGGTGGIGGAGFGPPSNLNGAGGGPGFPGGFFGTDGYFGGPGGNGGSSVFGSGGFGGRAATIGSITGGSSTGNSSGGGGAGAAYYDTDTINGSPGGDGSDGFVRIKW